MNKNGKLEFITSIVRKAQGTKSALNFYIAHVQPIYKYFDEHGLSIPNVTQVEGDIMRFITCPKCGGNPISFDISGKIKCDECNGTGSIPIKIK